jgi:enamine deaminase RidA (YjgF/YER057c/UK114 family)
MATTCLDAFGATLRDVVDMTTFIAGDLAVVYEPFQKVRLELMSPDLPSSASVGVAALMDPRLHYEVKMIAVAGTRG